MRSISPRRGGCWLLCRIGEGLLAPAGVACRSDRAVEAERTLELLACLCAVSCGEQHLPGTKPGLGLVRHRADLVERLRRFLELPVEDLAPGLQPEARRGLELTKTFAERVGITGATRS